MQHTWAGQAHVHYKAALPEPIEVSFLFLFSSWRLLGWQSIWSLVLAHSHSYTLYAFKRGMHTDMLTIIQLFLVSLFYFIKICNSLLILCRVSPILSHTLSRVVTNVTRMWVKLENDYKSQNVLKYIYYSWFRKVKAKTFLPNSML